MKRKYLTLLTLFVVLVFLILFYYHINPRKEFPSEPDDSFLPNTKEILSLRRNLHGSFIGDLVATQDNWATYTNKGFHYSVEIPSEITPYEEITTIEQGGLEYKKYVNYFSDHTTQERTLNITVRETEIPTIMQFIQYHQNYSKDNLFEEVKIAGVDGIFFSPNTKEGTSPEIVYGQTFFIKDGFVFEITTSNMPIEDAQRIWDTFEVIE